MSQHAIFFDKDGTLVDNVPYNVDLSRVTLARGAKACLLLLKGAAFKTFVISNQPGVALGLFEESHLDAVRRRIESLAEVELDGFYFCPHLASDSNSCCDCRKPEPGLITRAAAEHGIDLTGSWLIGDILDDIEAGRRAGVRTIFLDVGNETEWVAGEMRIPNFLARSLIEAAVIILRNTKYDETEHAPVSRLDPEDKANAWA